jgi:hypothetical protein
VDARRQVSGSATLYVALCAYFYLSFYPTKVTIALKALGACGFLPSPCCRVPCRVCQLGVRMSGDKENVIASLSTKV